MEQARDKQGVAGVARHRDGLTACGDRGGMACGAPTPSPAPLSPCFQTAHHALVYFLALGQGLGFGGCRWGGTTLFDNELRSFELPAGPPPAAIGGRASVASPVPRQPCPSRSLEEETSPASGYSYTHYMRFGQAASSLSRRASPASEYR